MGPTPSIVSIVAPTFEGEVFRKCRVCGKWKRLGNYDGRSHRCATCYVPGPHVGNIGSRNRAIVLTDKGRAAIRDVCHVVGCDAGVAPKSLMCRRHWFMAPAIREAGAS